METRAHPQSGIIRVEHDRQHPYKVINTSFANDERLTWGARGLLVYLLSKPNDWKMQVPDLVSQSPAGRDAVYSILKNLEENGYLQRTRTRRPDGTFEFCSVVYETAQPLPEKPEVEDPDEPEPLPAFPDTVEPDTVEPDTDKPEIYLIGTRPSMDRTSMDPPTPPRTRDEANGGGGGGFFDELVDLGLYHDQAEQSIKEGTIKSAADVARCRDFILEKEHDPQAHNPASILWANFLKKGVLPPRVRRRAGPPARTSQPYLTMDDVKRMAAETQARLGASNG